MNIKRLFSGHAADYKRFRPVYPDALFRFLARQSSSCETAWDCGTGNGQGATGLSQYFERVYATDVSAEQIAHAEPADNIDYHVAPAEQSGLAGRSVALITVFQALHWFDAERFFAEVRRIALPDAVLAVVGYHTAVTGIETIDQTYREFCFDYLWAKNCWAMHRGTLNENYAHIELPGKPMTVPEFYIEMRWHYQDYLAYLNTWSAVKTYEKRYGANPVETFVVPRIAAAWPAPDKKRLVKFPLIVRAHRL